MPITYGKNKAVFSQNCEIEESELLLEWFLLNKDGEVDLENLGSFHSAVLQVLLLAKPKIVSWPKNESCAWVKQMLSRPESC